MLVPGADFRPRRSGQLAPRESGPIGDRSHSSALFPAHGFMHNPNEVCIAPLKQLRDVPVEKALIRP
jgi:hypothetical protein